MLHASRQAEGSKHNRGYDEMTDRAFADYAGGAADERAPRTLLRQVMDLLVWSTPQSGGTSTTRIGNSIRL